MRRTLVVLVLCLAERAECHPPLVTNLRTINVSSLPDLKNYCRFSGHLYACTAFESRRLKVACSQCDQGWRIRAAVEVSPIVYLWDNRWLGHERLHLGDVSAALEMYRQHLESRRYQTQSDCEAAAAAETVGFARQVDLFATESNDRRHYGHSKRSSH